MKTLLTTLLTLLFAISVSTSQIIHVPGDYSDIQTAIDNASNNDTILLAEMEFFENIIITKALTLTSNYMISQDLADIENTIINGDNNGSVITAENIDQDTIRFIGITVTGGNGTLADPFGSEIFMPHGGGFFIDTVHYVQINHCRIIENHLLSEHNSAGGIFCSHSSISVMNSEVSENIVQGSSFFGEGGGLYLLESDAVVYNCIFHNNDSDIAYGQGGAIYARLSDLTLIDSDLTENSNIDGGAIYAYDSPLYLENVSMIDNFGIFGSAVLVYNNSETDLYFNNVIVTSNESLSNNQYGAVGLYKSSGSILNSVISDNASGYRCGGLSASYSDLLIQNSEFNDNVSSSGIGGEGGGLFLYQSDVEIRTTEVDNNELLDEQFFNSGGGIQAEYCNLLLDSMTISNNSAGQGGALLSILSNIRINRSLFHNNTCTQGGGIYSYGSYIQLLNSTIADNSADDGAFMYSEDTDFISVNSIIHNDDSYEIYFRQDSDTSAFLITYSSVRDHENSIMLSDQTEFLFSEGNNHEDPVFINAVENDYDSPLIDRGIDYFEYNGEAIIDISSEEYFGDAPDFGAFENLSGQSSIQDYVNTELRLFPVPAEDYMHVHTQNVYTTYKIYSVQGSEVQTGQIENETTHIDLSELKSGMYIMEVSNPKDKIRTRFLKL
jgi:hypothetical protein